MNLLKTEVKPTQKQQFLSKNPKVETPRIKFGKRQTVETLINEEALLFAKYLRNERKNGLPELISI